MAPAGACSSHRNPRRGGREVSEALYIWRDSELLTGPARALCQLGKARGYRLLPQPMVTGGGPKEVVILLKLHREEGSAVSLQK